MKAALLRRTEITFTEPEKIAPNATAHEQFERVEEWTQKSTSAPPSNIRRSAKEQENQDHHAKSQLIAEAVQLLESRDKQIRPKSQYGKANVQDSDADLYQNEAESHPYTMGKHFHNSKLSARNYVKDFENKMREKKINQEAILATYPSMRSRKDFLKSMRDLTSQSKGVVEPDSWRFKASRSVKFAVKAKSQLEENASPSLSDKESEEGDKWAMKQDNDKDWWRWKLKQRFVQNNELLHKLESQRQKLESYIRDGDKHRRNRQLIFNNKKTPGTPKNAIVVNDQIQSQFFPVARNSSWHVSVEIPSHMTPSKSGKRVAITTSQVRYLDPIPNYYTPSKQLVSAMTKGNTSAKSETYTKQSLKVLKKDPYLSKILAGNEMFRPEVMLDSNQQNKKRQVAADGKEGRRKLSLESLTDTEDEHSASKFFNPDVKVLFERLSEMEMMNNYSGDKSRLIGGVNSREPSDGFLNLPILLETGRFSRYNKLPSMKGISNYQEAPSKQQSKKSKSYRAQISAQKTKKSNNLTSLKLVHRPISGLNPTIPTDPNLTASKQQGQLENLPTNEWAKKLMSKVNKQDNSTKTEDGGSTVEDGKNTYEFHDIFNVLPHKYKVPVDQETNLLYHEILMSKWKKDKLSKENDKDGGKNKTTNIKWKRGEVGRDKNKTMEDLIRPRGLDIWLENIREKAKRDRLISPLPNNGDIDKVAPPLLS